MKKKNKVRHTKRSSGAQRESAAKELPPASPAPPPGPPLEGEELEQAIVKVLTAKYRETEERAAIRAESHGASDAAIEAALVSPRVIEAVKPVARAHGVEQGVNLARLFLRCARRMAESEKAAAGQSAILKIVFENYLQNFMDDTYGELFPRGSNQQLFTSAFEQSVLTNMLQIMRRQRAPVCAPETAASATRPQTSETGGE